MVHLEQEWARRNSFKFPSISKESIKYYAVVNLSHKQEQETIKSVHFA